MSFNLKQVQTKTGFSPIPTNRYNVRIESAEAAVSNAQNPMINLKLCVDDGEHKGRICFDSITLTDNSLWKVKTLLDLAGSKLSQSENVEEKEIAQELLFKKFSVYIYEQTDTNGVARNRIKDYRAYEDPTAKKVEPLF